MTDDLLSVTAHMEVMLQLILERLEWIQEVMRELYDSDDSEEECTESDADLGSEDTWSDEEDGSYESSFIDDEDAEHTLMSEDEDYVPSEESSEE